MKVSIEGNELVIRLPVNQPPIPSSTGRSLSVASSHGNRPTELVVNGKNVLVGVNAYISNK